MKNAVALLHAVLTISDFPVSELLTTAFLRSIEHCKCPSLLQYCESYISFFCAEKLQMFFCGAKLKFADVLLLCSVEDRLQMSFSSEY